MGTNYSVTDPLPPGQSFKRMKAKRDRLRKRVAVLEEALRTCEKLLRAEADAIKAKEAMDG